MRKESVARAYPSRQPRRDTTGIDHKCEVHIAIIHEVCPPSTGQF